MSREIVCAMEKLSLEVQLGGVDASSNDDQINVDEVEMPVVSDYDEGELSGSETSVSSQEEEPGAYFSNPVVTAEMGSKENFSWRVAQKAADGPRCWKCYRWNTFFYCESCERSYHRECAFMGPGYPQPEFDKPIAEACRAEWGVVTLVKCAVCIVAEETRMSYLKKFSKEDINKALFLAGTLVYNHYAGDLLQKLPTATYGIKFKDILNKASNGEYFTVEGFYADCKMVYYNLYSKYGKESEEELVGQYVLTTLSQEVKRAIACVECSLRRFDVSGRFLNSKEYSPVNRLACGVPHVLVWMKEIPHSYWPAKVLMIDGPKKQMFAQCFGSKGDARCVPFPGDPKEILFKAYSTEYPQGKLREKDRKSWSAAMADCRLYIANLRERFGENGVVIPETAEEFDGNLVTAVKRMFPLYDPNQ